MLTADTVLSRLYDGRDYERTTIGRGSEKIPNPYLTVLLASTEYLPSLFSEGLLRQGFLNRFIYVVVKKSRRKPLRITLGNETEENARRLLEWLKALHHQSNVVELEFSPEAKNLYDEYEVAVEKRIENEELGLKEGYYGNLPNFLIRLASIFRISRLTHDELQNNRLSSLIIREDDFHRALEYVGQIWKWFEEVVQLMQRPAISPRVMTEEHQINRIMSVIRAHGDEKGWVTRTCILKESDLTSDPLGALLQKLIDRGDLESKKMPSSAKGGRPTTVYREIRKDRVTP
jgi:hypothetical protein